MVASSRTVGRKGGTAARRYAAAFLPAVAVALGAAFLAIAADPPAQPISVAAPIMPPPLAAGPTPDLDLLFSAQVAGWVEPCG